MIKASENMKPIPNFGGKYLVDEYGNIYNAITQKKIKPQNNGNGYKKITLTINGKQFQKYVHRLVAEAFIPNPDNQPQVNHINGIKSDNRLENLEWVSCSQNQIHAIKKGLRAIGNELWNGKFSKDQIHNIFSLSKSGLKRYLIAQQMGCSKSTISDILNGRRYVYYALTGQELELKEKS